MSFKCFLNCLFIFLFIAGCTVSKNSKIPEKDNESSTSSSYFFPIPLTAFSSANVPCVLLEVEGRSISSILDTGFDGILSFSEDTLSKVEGKVFIRNREKWGFNGKKFENPLYQISKVKIGEGFFHDPYVESEDNAFRSNGCLLDSEENDDSSPEGRVGWKLFEKENLLLDLSNEKIAICSGLMRLKEEGYEVESFVTVPLWTERGFVEFEVETSKGPLRCVLDSGSTWNAWNSRKKEWSLEDWVKDSVFRIGGEEFRSQKFLLLPIQLPIDVEAILGMEFLKDHVVFIEFTKGKIHIAERKDRQMAKEPELQAQLSTGGRTKTKRKSLRENAVGDASIS